MWVIMGGYRCQWILGMNGPGWDPLGLPPDQGIVIGYSIIQVVSKYWPSNGQVVLKYCPSIVQVVSKQWLSFNPCTKDPRI